MKNTKYLPTIGLEVHVQLKTKSKMFCGCENNSWKIGQEEIKPNTAICPVCTGQPGALPVANQDAIKMVVKAGLALGCQIAQKSKFDRKNYFYPDLPKGYQISQYDMPICGKGNLEIWKFGNLDEKIRNKRLFTSGKKIKDKTNEGIGITRIHLEEDTARNIHPAGKNFSLIDFNRSGVPLMELVTEPDIHSPKDAKEFCQSLQQILRAIDISDAHMEKSQMRCEVNVSLSKTGKLGTKVEIKNLNSFKAVERSIEYEIIRQSKILDQNEKVIHQTRGWDVKQQITIAQRSKEYAHDYRYFPEPDIPPMVIDKNLIDKIRAEMPELPPAKAERFQSQYGFSPSNTKVLITNPLLADFAENVMSELRAWLVDLDEIELQDDQAWDKYKQKLSKLTANWLINKLNGSLVAQKISIEQSKITAENFAELITLIYKNKVNSKSAQNLLATMVKNGGDPTEILEDEGLHLIEDVSDIEPIVDKVIADNSKQAEQFRLGKQTLLKFFIGQVMKESKGQANPKMAEEMLLQKLC
ncbi:MAG: Asp-tRNA(Asn)/Glu-tRNA(Gln) amidotransferase subunit GatB [Candidatus Kuenenbacteria bacterium]